MYIHMIYDASYMKSFDFPPLKKANLLQKSCALESKKKAEALLSVQRMARTCAAWSRSPRLGPRRSGVHCQALEKISAEMDGALPLHLHLPVWAHARGIPTTRRAPHAGPCASEVRAMDTG